VIYAIGLETDKTFTYFLAEMVRRSLEVQPINLRAVAEAGSWRLAVPDDGVSWVEAAGEHITLDPWGSYFCRLVDLSTVQALDERALTWRGMTYGLAAWLSSVPGKVINRPWGWSDNFTKPLHEATLGSLGFLVPESLTTVDTEALSTFVDIGLTILKTISSTRADVRLLDRDALLDFCPEAGPLHVQRFIKGFDVRAHVIGRQVFAERIITDEVDYRCADAKVYEPWSLPDRLNQQVVESTANLGLAFAGWDFKVDHEGRYWCLEANPMPGYHGYDARLDHRISTALIDELSPLDLGGCFPKSPC
jgi:glutathione synthase/RimK-type ligase-like ATP-grasp enzyme